MKPVLRILHVVGAMNRAGAETWLMHVLRRIDRRQFRMDFLVHSASPGSYDDEIRRLGSAILCCADPRRPWMYARSLRRILREHGPYDVVHGHQQHFTGLALKVARRASVPARIAHAHTDDRAVQRSAGPPRRLYLALMRRWIRAYATAGLAASEPAAAALYGPAWRRDPRWRVLHCGFDVEAFRGPADRAAALAELGLPPEAFVLGHVGRFHESKNHELLLSIAAEVARHEPRTRLLLVGAGALRSAVEQRARELGIRERVVFAGERSDVPRLMRSAMDVFVFPSLYEGLSLGLLEAQAAGLPCVFADVVPLEADVAKPLLRRVGLDAAPAVWAAAVLEQRPSLTAAQACDALAESSFNIEHAADALTRFYVASFRPAEPPRAAGDRLTLWS